MSKIEELIQELCPDGVECLTLGSMGSFQNIGTDKKIVDGEREVRLLNYMDVYKNKYIDNKIPKMIVTANEKKYKECTALYGDIFVTPTSETRDDIGHASVITEDLVETCYSYHIMRYRLHRQCIVTSKYLRYAIESDDCKKQIYKFAQGMTRYGLSMGKFEQLQIPIPPLPIQEEIVRILDEYSAKVEELKSELAKEKDARRKQYEYYRDALLEFGEDVPRKELGEICEIKRGASPRPISEFITEAIDGIPWVKIGDASKTDKYIRKTEQKITIDGSKKSKLVKVGDFILSNSMSFGKPYIMSIDGCIHDGWLSISGFQNTLNSDFLYHLISSNKMQSIFKQKASNGGAVSNLNADIVKKIDIPVPPLAVQQQIVEILDKFDAYCNDITQGLPAEIEMRTKQYEYYRDKLLSFKDINK